VTERATTGTGNGAGTGLRLTIIGPAAAWTTRSLAASSCYLVEHGGRALVLDLGQGSFAAMSRHRDPADVCAVLVSHLHPDHCIDLVPLRHYLSYGIDPPGQVRLHGPAALRDRFDALLAETDFLARLPGEPLTERPFEVPPFAVTARRVRHADESYAFRVIAEPHLPGLVYSGDCADPADLIPLIRPGDTLLCEAAFGVGPNVPGANHLDARMAALAARDGGAARLVLTHLLDGVDAREARQAARSIFRGPVLVARPGLALDIP
jgi:ribonuclease BN (tRNA processing enzyme)